MACTSNCLIKLYNYEDQRVIKSANDTFSTLNTNSLDSSQISGTDEFSKIW